jgi:hypothetical protein
VTQCSETTLKWILHSLILIPSLSCQRSNGHRFSPNASKVERTELTDQPTTRKLPVVPNTEHNLRIVVVCLLFCCVVRKNIVIDQTAFHLAGSQVHKSVPNKELLSPLRTVHNLLRLQRSSSVFYSSFSFSF